ncbi:MAG TPA: pilus assembly protein TadG-related protein [Candidatus Obscuribacterales bacterium]
MFFRIYAKNRERRGSLIVLIPAVVLIAIIGIGAFAMDVSHNVTVRTELQNAVDAAALAGAQDFKDASTWPSVDADALQVAQQNTADGRNVSNSTSGASVTVQSQTPGQNNSPGECQVGASMQITDLFAKLFAHNNDTIDVTSTADYWNTVNSIEANQMMPIAPSLDDTSQGPALSSKKLGDQLTITIKPSGGNAAWTSGTMTHPSTTVLREALDVALGLAQPTPGANPAMVADGTTQIALTQGLHNGVDLSAAPYAGLIEGKQYVVLPVITGSNPYVQSRVLMGFIAMKVTSISTGPDSLTLNGTLVKGLVKGAGGMLPNAGVSDPTQTLSQLSVGTVKLVQ